MANNDKKISDAVVKRLPRYLRIFRELSQSRIGGISSRKIASLMGVTASQVRQDFCCFGGFGQQGYGYDTVRMVEEISAILGLDREYKMIIVGAGNIGRALVNYKGFKDDGFFVTAMFDVAPPCFGENEDEKRSPHPYAPPTEGNCGKAVASSLVLPRRGTAENEDAPPLAPPTEGNCGKAVASSLVLPRREISENEDGERISPCLSMSSDSEAIKNLDGIKGEVSGNFDEKRSPHPYAPPTEGNCGKAVASSPISLPRRGVAENADGEKSFIAGNSDIIRDGVPESSDGIKDGVSKSFDGNGRPTPTPLPRRGIAENADAPPLAPPTEGNCGKAVASSPISLPWRGIAENADGEKSFIAGNSGFKKSENIPIYGMEKLEEYIAENPADIAVIAVPKDEAEGVLVRLTKAGIRNFWNFAPVELHGGEGITIENISMSDSLFVLSYMLNRQLKNES